MQTAEVVQNNGVQMVKLPAGFHFDVDTVSIRREGAAVILEPVKPATWPPGFFERIAIEDPTFTRPPQGVVPPVPPLG